MRFRSLVLIAAIVSLATMASAGPASRNPPVPGSNNKSNKPIKSGLVGASMTAVIDRINNLGPQSVQVMFESVGMDQTGATAIVESNWDEDVVVDQILRCNAYRILNYITVAEMAKLSSNNLARLKGPIIAARYPELLQWGLAYPMNERNDFREAVGQIYATMNPFWPVYTTKQAKYWGTDKDMITLGDAQDVIGLVLATEYSLNAAQMSQAKERLKNIAVLAARKKLRAEGKSFVSYPVVTTNVVVTTNNAVVVTNSVVVTTMVNPIIAVVQPVVDSVNAAAYTGIETAFSNLGVPVAPVPFWMRARLSEMAMQLKTQILSGEIIGTENPNHLPKLSVILGVVEYNKFIDDYNKGNQ